MNNTSTYDKAVELLDRTSNGRFLSGASFALIQKALLTPPGRLARADLEAFNALYKKLMDSYNGVSHPEGYSRSPGIPKLGNGGPIRR
jgi:hypothetical protein